MAAQILVVEDEPAIQELISVNLIRAGHEVLRADDAEAAQSMVHISVPDLVLIDWVLPGMSGIAFTQRLRSDARTRNISIILLTARSSEQNKIVGLEAGADDYITKPFSPRELLARIDAVLRRRAPLSSEVVVEVGGLRLDPTTQRVKVAGVDVTLGTIEFRVLHFLMTHPDRVYSRTQLMTHVWGDHLTVDERTVDVHIRRLRISLKSGQMDALIQTVRGSGYRFSAK